MTKTIELIEKLKAEGIELSLWGGGNVQFKGPRDAITSETMEELRLHKAEIIARLKTEISRGCSVVKRGTGDFTQVYRPCRISEMVGNEETKRIIAKIFKENCVPHSFLSWPKRHREDHLGSDHRAGPELRKRPLV